MTRAQGKACRVRSAQHSLVRVVGVRENLLRKRHHAEVWRRRRRGRRRRGRRRRRRNLPNEGIRAGWVENEVHVFLP